MFKKFFGGEGKNETTLLVSPKYYIGETVFFLEDGKIRSSTITAIAVFTTAHGKEIRYSTEENTSLYSIRATSKEENLFPSKEAVIASLWES